jgi:hypothetical protein
VSIEQEKRRKLKSVGAEFFSGVFRRAGDAPGLGRLNKLPGDGFERR